MTLTTHQDRPLDWMVNSGLNGLTALVVGGGSGIGEATAKVFAANGGAVVVADLRPEAAERVSAEIVATGGSAIHVAMNIARQEDIDAAVVEAIARFGRLDVVINSAALVRPEKLETCSIDEWRACFQVNVDGALLLARTCLPHLRKSPSASIINVTSLGGVWGRPNGGAYGPSKAALMTLSRQMALEWATYGVRVNAVNPGTIDTPLARATVPEQVLAERATKIPMGRLGTPTEMANLIVFLASPAASYITAQVFTCDGGHSQSMFSAPMGT
ncbi:SDR family NAD(P)-dependent oxidoreductase [Caballeronia zhejiangensis]|uniref:SDR family NAD(P)-dependent oxidoreductase n=1 Tax=Caballeronia zhejiangensis TaxID=871203 RepID=UPI001EF61F25|nr:SDR family oxidoreductase [Caballeronia zhejiangensis]MCG7400345.1 SDR family oxidoreductase [Caballeronia zhejiangensis]